MAGKFTLKKFADINLNDTFFITLKADYPGTANSTGFVDWFNKKINDYIQCSASPSYGTWRLILLAYHREDGMPNEKVH